MKNSQGPAAVGSVFPIPHPTAVGALEEDTDEAYEAYETELIRGIPRWRLEELKAKHAIDDEHWNDEPEDEEPEDE